MAGVPVVGPWGPASLADTPKVDFKRNILPIFKAHCFECHGPKKQEAKLRLDARQTAMIGGESGPAIQAGNSAGSLLVDRITAKDDDERMPPSDSGKKLSAGEIKLLQAWIDGGAAYAALVAGSARAAEAAGGQGQVVAEKSD